jgi:PAS domain S-box-containing protein
VTGRGGAGGRRTSPRGLRRDVSRIAILVVVLLVMVSGLAIFWLRFATVNAGGGKWLLVGVLSVLAMSALAVAAVVFLARRVVRFAIDPLQRLARSAVQISASGQARIMDSDREDEIGELARALQAWKDSSAERQILADGAPIGICRIDLEGRVLTANSALKTMHGGTSEDIVGHQWWEFIHPDDHHHQEAVREALFDRHFERYQLEARHVRADGSLLWCSMTIAPVPGIDGRPESFILIEEDISDRKGHAELAARIQRELLPHVVPEVEGYEVAGACLSAMEVAGDFYDWVLDDEGKLQFTVADVMGKGMGAALVTATIRAVLRAAPAELGPAARVRLAADSMVGTDAGLFATLFHGCLDPTTGTLRYVDAGHGYCVILRRSGELVRLTERSIPVGVLPDAEFLEGVARLEPGDSLLVYSDGLVETEERTIQPQELMAGIDDSMHAAEVVRRLIARMPPSLSDDVTAVALRRLSESSPMAGAAAGHTPSHTEPEGGL